MKNVIEKSKVKHGQSIKNRKRQKIRSKFRSLFQTIHFLIYRRKMKILNTFFRLTQLKNTKKVQLTLEKNINFESI